MKRLRRWLLQIVAASALTAPVFSVMALAVFSMKLDSLSGGYATWLDWLGSGEVFRDLWWPPVVLATAASLQEMLVARFVKDEA